jgi:hypothetical protein
MKNSSRDIIFFKFLVVNICHMSTACGSLEILSRNFGFRLSSFNTIYSNLEYANF